MTNTTSTRQNDALAMNSKVEYGGKFDTVVIGGGMSGVCAAIAAARLGCRVLLIQDRPVLGGNSSSEIRVAIGGAEGHGNRHARESGIIEELRIEDRFRNHNNDVNGQINSIWDMILWEWVKREQNITLYLNTTARRAIKKADQELSLWENQIHIKRRFVPRHGISSPN